MFLANQMVNLGRFCDEQMIGFSLDLASPKITEDFLLHFLRHLCEDLLLDGVQTGGLFGHVSAAAAAPFGGRWFLDWRIASGSWMRLESVEQPLPLPVFAQ